MPTDLKSYRSGDPESKQGRSDSRLRQMLEQTNKPNQPVTSRLTGNHARGERGNGAAPRDRGQRS